MQICCLDHSSINLQYLYHNVFDVGTNQIKGRIAFEIGNVLPNFEFVSIDYNQFTGSIPISISINSNLFNLEIGWNKLTAGVPALDKLHKLWWFVVAFNNLGSGHSDDLDFLYSLINATSLVEIDLRCNIFGGMLTETIGNLSTNLQNMYLNQNQILGSIPPGIGNLINLESLWLYENQFTSNIPCDILKLQRLVFNENELSGLIPSSQGNLKLQHLRDLSQNNLHVSHPKPGYDQPWPTGP